MPHPTTPLEYAMAENREQDRIIRAKNQEIKELTLDNAQKSATIAIQEKQLAALADQIEKMEFQLRSYLVTK